ncbi:DUF6531 domain-containing protein [Streptomyces sulphureus]|uniref:DUF6531 domain-containing protein n=1 Tax=Streptomyces sulphureus TaxID=47758 RepID=UPI000367E680|nr:DUF6531 domain-containing protein [Streptomyces sulphureus]
MGVLDEVLSWLESAGLVWPDGDSGKLRQAATAWRTFAGHVDDIWHETNHSAHRITSVNSGEAADQFELFWAQYVRSGEHGWLPELERAAREMAKSLDGLADQIDDVKAQIRSEIVGNLALLATCMALAPETGGISMAVGGGKVAHSIIELSERLGKSIAASAVRILSGALMNAAIGAIANATLELAVAQPMRVALGKQPSLSLDDVKRAAQAGAVHGAIGGPETMVPHQTIVPAVRPNLLGDFFHRQPGKRPSEGEPVDVATGAMFMEQTDLELPGAFPLVFSRTYLSSYRAGVCFGPTWVSTVDEQVQLDDQGAVFAAADGMRLVYPVPEPGVATLPVSGPRWPLEWDGKPDGEFWIRDPDTGVVRTFTHARPTDADATVRLPIDSWQDRNGERIEVVRTANGAPTALCHSGGYTVAVETEGQRVTALRLLDEGTAYGEWPAGRQTGKLLVRYGYDEAGHLAEVTNSSGRPLRFTYDAAGRMLSWTDRNGTWFSYEYDERGRVVRTSGIDGIFTGHFTYDDSARTTTYTDSHGETTVCVYNDHGQLTARTDPLGNTTRTRWNDRGTEPLAVTDPLGRTTRYEYDENGDLVRVTLPDGSEAKATYNALHQPLTVTGPSGARWTHTYDPAGNLTATTDPAGASTTHTYDTGGHLVAVTDALGRTRTVENNTAGLPVSITDALGHVTAVERDAFGRVTQVTDPLGHTTRMAWTVEGRPLWREDAEGGQERWSWDGEGNLLSHTDAAGNTTRHTPGPFDVPATRTDPDGAEYTFTHDTELRLTRVTNPQGLHWDYTYDAAGRLTAESDFNGATLTYALDAAGQLLTRTNAEGQTLHYTRDALGRIVEQLDASTDERTTFTYDAAGALTSATNPDAELHYERDVLGRVLTETTNGRTTSYTYDALGRTLTRTTPSGLTSHWTYDAEGRHTHLANDHGALSFTHDAAGREVERRMGDVLFTHTWDTADRLTTQTARTGDQLLQHRAYTYRPDGHLTHIRELTAGTRHFTLDPMGRITQVQATGWRETYTYDPAGNQSHAEAPDHPSPGDRHLTGTLIHRAGHTHYTHDTAGRRTTTTRRLLNGQRKQWTYTWNAEDRLRTAETPDGTWTYAYDPLGRRISKTGPDGDTLTFAWDGTRLAEQCTTQGTVTTWDYEPGTHRPLVQTDHTQLARESGASLLEKLEPIAGRPQFCAVQTDLVGAPTEIVTVNGEVRWQCRTSLWGTDLFLREDNATCQLRFPGQYADTETGLVYNYYRYYDPESAGYISPDPLGLTGGMNEHAYVKNPHLWLDPFGLKGCGPGGGNGNQPDVSINEKQFGKKWGKHAQDYGLDPGDSASREWFRSRMHAVHGSPDEVRQGAWNPDGGGGADYLFFRKGGDLMVTRPDGEFVTMFPQETPRGWFAEAKVIHTRK